MKIFYYSPNPFLNLSAQTGYGTHMRETLKGFEAQHEVRKLIVGGETQSDVIGAGPGVVKRLAKSVMPGFWWRSLKDNRILKSDGAWEKELQLQVTEFNPDVLYERDAYLNASGLNVAKANSNLTYVVECNAPYAEEREKIEGRSSYQKKAREIQKQKFERADHIITVSSPMAKYFSKEYGIPIEKFSAIHNAANPKVLVPSAQKAEEIRNQYDLNGQFVVGFVGSIFPYHGVETLLDGFKILAPDYPDVKLLIVGDGAIVEELKEQCEAAGLANRVVFTGPVPHEQVASYISVFDVAVLPQTEWYMSPVKLFEYGFLNRPIVAPDAPSVHDVMVNGVDGILVKSHSDHVAQALRQLIDDPAKASEMGMSFGNKVRSQHTWDKVVTQTLALFEKLN